MLLFSSQAINDVLVIVNKSTALPVTWCWLKEVVIKLLALLTLALFNCQCIPVHFTVQVLNPA